MADQIVERRPPDAVVRVINPLLRLLLRSPAGRLVPALAVLEFQGRRTGSRYRIVTGWYTIDGQQFATSPARWRANFADTAPLTVRHAGKTQVGTGTLETSPGAVATALRAVLEAGTSPQALGLRIPPGHRLTEDDVVATHKALIRFHPGQ